MHETLRRFRAGDTVETIASNRGLAASTIIGHLAQALESGEDIDLGRFLKPEERAEIEAVFKQLGFEALSPVFESLGRRYGYGLIHLVRAAMSVRANTSIAPKNGI